MNGGVVALNATTGVQKWEWYTNSLQNPGGGGGRGGHLHLTGRILSSGRAIRARQPGRCKELRL